MSTPTTQVDTYLLVALDEFLEQGIKSGAFATLGGTGAAKTAEEEATPLRSRLSAFLEEPSMAKKVRRPKVIDVTVRWRDGYLEEFGATEVRFGSDLLWLRLVAGGNRRIPLRMVRWFQVLPESHAFPSSDPIPENCGDT